MCYSNQYTKFMVKQYEFALCYGKLVFVLIRFDILGLGDGWGMKPHMNRHDLLKVLIHE